MSSAPHPRQPGLARGRRVILIGPSGSGKSVVARRVVERLQGWAVVDSDDAIRTEFGTTSISQIFQELGESEFRAAEARFARDLIDGPEGLVIATGGGLPAVENSMVHLLSAGVTVFLRASLETLWRRIQADEEKAQDLPMLGEGGMLRLKELMSARASYYERAHLTLDTDLLSVEEVVESLSAVIDSLLPRR